MTNGQDRAARVQFILNIIQRSNEEKGIGADRAKLAFWMSDELKVSPQKIQEYITELILKERVIVKDRMLWLR